MYLQKYDFAVNYVPDKDLIRSDTLSRAPLTEQTSEISESEISCQVHSVISISKERLKQLEIEMLNDKTLQSVANYIAQRWPKLKN